MKRIIKQILIKGLYYSGLPYVFREIVGRKKVTIIVLHDPNTMFASKQFQWLSSHYNIISLEQYLSVRTGKSSDQLPDKSLIITIDDGHICNHNLLPILKESKIPVTIFLCSGIINTNRHFWFKFPGLKFSSDYYKEMPNHTRTETLAKLGFDKQKEFSFPMALNKSQIEEMKEVVNFQSHTIYHPCLTQCDNNESWMEIVDSKKQLEAEYNLEINAIAYPNGNYSERDIEFVKRAGYLCGLSVGYGFNGKKADLYKLERFSVNDDDDKELLAIKASGIWIILKHYLWGAPKGIKNFLFISGGKYMRSLIFILPGMEYIPCFEFNILV